MGPQGITGGDKVITAALTMKCVQCNYQFLLLTLHAIQSYS